MVSERILIIFGITVVAVILFSCSALAVRTVVGVAVSLNDLQREREEAEAVVVSYFEARQQNDFNVLRSVVTDQFISTEPSLQANDITDPQGFTYNMVESINIRYSNAKECFECPDTARVFCLTQ